jgi:hypothetical protein
VARDSGNRDEGRSFVSDPIIIRGRADGPERKITIVILAGGGSALYDREARTSAVQLVSASLEALDQRSIDEVPRLFSDFDAVADAMATAMGLAPEVPS